MGRISLVKCYYSTSLGKMRQNHNAPHQSLMPQSKNSFWLVANYIVIEEAIKMFPNLHEFSDHNNHLTDIICNKNGTCCVYDNQQDTVVFKNSDHLGDEEYNLAIKMIFRC
eukprot:jgi/Psemu1/40123/gm1.40123_g